jgi:ATP-grasp domain, R2K clade family 3
VLSSPHPDAVPGDAFDAGDVIATLSSALNRIDARFVTADVVRRADDGLLRLVEIGNGQVSNRPSCVDAGHFIACIVAAEV